MNRDQARNLVKETLTQKFDKGRFTALVGNLLNRIDTQKTFSCNNQYVKDAFKPHVNRYERIAKYTAPDQRKIDILVVHLTENANLGRTRTALRNFVADYLKNRDRKDAALVAFVSPSDSAWRFSYVKMEYATVEKPSGDIGAEARLTPARRFSYLVGPGESCHTAQTRFVSLLQDTTNNPTLTDIEAAFSVEAVTREFFARYKELFLAVKDELDRIAADEKAIQGEFSQRKLSTADFAKKLLGQIVFLYFLQKKGWLGVAKDGAWGNGPHNFLRRLANGDYGQRNNLFNDTLEPLFYDTLATDRGHEALCKKFNCRIPFLNGGLFEPLGGYDWRNTEILLPNELFTNTEPVEEGIIGTGILDVFDRYNFTVNEAEPLEKEVAIDPEMLGKVFENLLEVKERKSKGSFYTPREIVHYMCQESLINYLDTAINGNGNGGGNGKGNGGTDIPACKLSQGDTGIPACGVPPQTQTRMSVPRCDIETLVHSGDQAAHYETARVAGTISYRAELPPGIENNARSLDEALASITVCDPAIGSGAFPVGMMHEIVRARSALTPYFNGVAERTAYHFKRHAIQNCLYGVDIDPGAVEIAKLRLWLSLVVDEEDVQQIKPLPNLDYKVVVGNSLLGVEKTLFNQELFTRLEEIKPKYFDETNSDKKHEYRKEINQLIQNLTDGQTAFDFEIYFSEVFHRNGGFDVVIGNPPYLFARNSKEKGITAADKKIYNDTYMLAEYQINLYPLFIERGTGILRESGSFAFITPNNWLTINTNGLLRNFVLNRSEITIVNFYARMFAGADVDNSIIIYKKSAGKRRIKLFEYRSGLELVKEADCDFFLQQRHSIINIDAQKGDHVAALMQKIESRADRLRDVADARVGLKAYQTGKGRPPQEKKAKDGRIFHSGDQIDETYIKYLDGRDVSRYRLGWGGEYLKYGRHLAEPRTQFRLFSTKRILVRQIPANPPYCIHACIAEETLLNDLNSMNIINSREPAELVLGILNARLTSFWFVHRFGKMQRRTFPQFKVNELAEFPLPRGRERRQAEIIRLVGEAMSARRSDPGADIGAIDREIDRIVYSLYDLTPEEIAVVEGATDAPGREPKKSRGIDR